MLHVYVYIYVYEAVIFNETSCNETKTKTGAQKTKTCAPKTNTQDLKNDLKMVLRRRHVLRHNIHII